MEKHKFYLPQFMWILSSISLFIIIYLKEQNMLNLSKFCTVDIYTMKAHNKNLSCDIDNLSRE